MTTLAETAARLVAGHKGLLAADESTGTIRRRFDSQGIVSTPESRRDYREMLFGAADAMRDYVSGVILYDETIRQKAADGTPLVDIITAAGAVPGIKVDMGPKDLAGSPGEQVTEGLDGLRERLAEYHALGARFAKWRAVIAIGAAPHRPSYGALLANAHALARYAALCQEAGIVPIVEPEVLMDGPEARHDIETSYKVTELTLKIVFEQLYFQNVDLTGTILKPSMVIAGKLAPVQASPEAVAERTLACLKACVPPAVPGIAFLSGGQSEVEATHHLALMNAAGPLPWKLTFSYGRALQAPALAAWAGKAENVAAGRSAFAHRARMNALAAAGTWTPESERQAA